MATEKRLIDANAFKCVRVKDKSDDFCDGVLCVLDMIDAQPTVDAVEVVRCKDCKYYRHGTSCVCELHSEEPDQYGRGFEMQMLPNDFCPYGERRTDE